MLNKRSAITERRATYTALTGIFFAIFGLFNLFQGRKKRQPSEVKPFELLMLGLSAYRLGRLVAYDKVAEPYRSVFTETVSDPSGAGDTVMPRGTGWRRALGELISCPICAGTWISAILVYGMEIAPGPTRTFMTMMSAIGLGELLNAGTEAMQWVGQYARELAGNEIRAKQSMPVEWFESVDRQAFKKPA